MRAIGVNTWVWTSPLTDSSAPGMIEKVAELGFDAVELPLENAGDLTAAALRGALDATGLVPCVVGAMAPGRDLVAASAEDVARHAGLPAGVRRPGSRHRRRCGVRPVLRRHRAGVADEPDRAAGGVRRAAREPGAGRRARAGGRRARSGSSRSTATRPRWSTPHVQGLDALGELLSPHLGLALDSYHLNIEERSSADAIREAGSHLVHVQVCGNDRGAPGGDQTDWPGFLTALDEVGYAGPLVIESFTAENASIATAASIWRPLASTQDDLAVDGLRFLRHLTSEGTA